MISVYCAVGIICGLFLFIFDRRRKENLFEEEIYSLPFCVFCYILSRAVFLLMREEHTPDMWQCLCMDLAAVTLLFLCLKKKAPAEKARNIIMLYIFQPGTILMAASGRRQGMAAMLVLLVFVFTFVYIKEKDGFCYLDFFPEYVIGSIGIYLYSYATGQLGQTVKDLWNTDENVPMILILAIVLCIVSFALAECKQQVQKQKQTKIVEINETDTKKEFHITKKDVIFMTLFTMGFAMVAFYRLGSFSTPQSYQYFSTEKTGNNEIVLNFGKQVTLSRLEVFLGYEGKRKVSLSVPENGQWKVIDSNDEITSVFAWNELQINQSLQYLGCVFLDSEAYVLEIVAFDENGQQILPVNSTEYPRLFDEQQLYPKYETYYDGTIFDEVYHGRTAYEFLNGLPIYENTHPPLGKIIISLGISIFSMCPFGWRFMCVICGSLIIPVIYLFGLRITGKTKYACIGALLLATEFMHFTLSRIATIDIIVALFILLMFYFMYCFVQEKKSIYLFLCGIATALAISTKWTGIYAAVGIAVIFFTWLFQEYQGKKPDRASMGYLIRLFFVCVVSFLLIPSVTYVVSYIPFAKVYTDKGVLGHAIANSQLMLNYHKNTVFEHPYSSEWYEWIVDKIPLLDSYHITQNDKLSVIATFGSPLIWWGGFAALVHQVYLWRCKKNRTAQYLVLTYAAMLIPWLFIHRTVFIYQYYVCSLILILMICHSIFNLKKYRNCMFHVVAGAAIVLFIMFYPVLSGMSVDKNFIIWFLKWLPTWYFV